MRVKPPTGSKARRNAGIVVGSVFLLLLLVGALILGTKLGSANPQNGNTANSSNLSGVTSTRGTNNGTNGGAMPTPTPTAIPSGTVLYQANGFTDHWVSSSTEWKPVGRIMGCDGTGTTSFTTWAPKLMPVANYEVSAQIQFVRSTYNQYPSFYGENYEFGIVNVKNLVVTAL